MIAAPRKTGGLIAPGAVLSSPCRWGLDEGPTEAYTFFLREFPSVAMCVDGWPYPFATVKDAPDLASHYSKGTSICALDDLRAAAAGWVRAIAEFGE